MNTTNAVASTSSSTIIPILSLLLSGCDGPKQVAAYGGIPTAYDIDRTPFVTRLTPTEVANEYLISDAWGGNLVAEIAGNPTFIGAYPYAGTLTISDNCSVTITGDAAFATGGTGSYNPATHSFSYSLNQALFANAFITDVVLTLPECPGPVFETTYVGVPSANGSDWAPFLTQLTPTNTINNYLITTAWGENFVAGITENPSFNGSYPYSGTLSIADDCSVSITGDAAFATGGTGSYNPLTGSFSYSLNQALFADPFITDVVLNIP